MPRRGVLLSVRIIFSFTQSSPFEARYLLARVPGAKKDGGDHLLSTNTQHIARLGREVQPEPAKEGRNGADDLTGGEVWDRGFDSLPWHHRSDALYEVIIGLGFSCFSLTAGKDRHLGEAQLVRPLLMTAKTLSEAGGSSPPSSHKYRSDAIFHNFFDYWYTQGGQVPPTTGRYTAARSGNDAVVHIWYICRGFDSPRPDQLN